MSEIRAKVATIVSEHQLALNAGSDQGVELNDVVHVIREVDVDDPDSNERLGTVRIVRLRLKVNYIQNKLCVAIVTDQYGRDESGVGTIAALLAARRIRKVTSQHREGLPGEYCQISPGDTVVIKKEPPAENEESDA
ncbi:hypothetical protein ACN28G_17665 [Micromonospora sp. WMMA1923]|uniref:hypothetical protein n=1 Tax=Micromonospora sp. WMMA1923 TaxID=3404125 RepID=UPI003B92B942